MEYPDEAEKMGITGIVYVNFIIEQDGSISNARILRDIGGGCGEEVLRVVNSMPKWNPGKQRGKTVRVQYNLPVKFTLEDNENNSSKE
jgi:protein TonB